MKSNYTEEDFQQALNTVANRGSVRKAERDYGIPRSTLQNRIYSHVSMKEAKEYYQRLSPVQEQHLTDWVLTQEAIGQNPTHLQIRTFAGRVLAARGDAIPLGKRWMQGFLKRNPILRTKKQFKIDSARVNGATTTIIKV